MSKPQLKVLRYMVNQYDRGVSVSVRDVCRHFGWSSANAAHQHMRSLAAQGLLEHRGKGKSIRLMPLALKLYSRRGK